MLLRKVPTPPRSPAIPLHRHRCTLPRQPVGLGYSHGLQAHVRIPIRAFPHEAVRNPPVKRVGIVTAGFGTVTMGPPSSRVSTAATTSSNASTTHQSPQPTNLSGQLSQPQTDAQPPPRVEICDALIVGAGPSGLATALLLAQRRHQKWERIILLEKRSAIDLTEPDKSYMYMIDGRGRSLTDVVGVTEAVKEAGVQIKGMPVAQLLPDGTYKEFNIAIGDTTTASTWLTRRAFIKALYGGLESAEREGRVRLLSNVQVTDIQLAAGSGGGDSANPIVVHARDVATGREFQFAPRLLVGADGFNSIVRQALEKWAPAVNLPADHFRPVVLNSPSAGLRYQVLPLPPNPTFTARQQRDEHHPPGVASKGGSSRLVPNSQSAVIVGIKAAPNRAMRLGLLPLGEPSSPRTGNVITKKDHIFWTLDSGKQLGAFLQESFPQVDIPSLFTEQQLDAIAASRGGVFPAPQYVKHLVAVLPGQVSGIPGLRASEPQPSPPAVSQAAPRGGSRGDGTGGVVLCGDAVHCFPPDLGQGVNSSMLDALGLAQALDEADGDLARALPLYESLRAPEAAALVEIMTFGAPYQDKFKGGLWALNLLLRSALHNLFPWAFSPQTAVLTRCHVMSYVQIRDRVHATTQRIWLLVGALVVALGMLAIKALAAAAGAPIS